MSSNIQLLRICQHCSKEFTARTTVTQYCGDLCATRAYKARIRAAKIEASNQETQQKKSQPMAELKAKEFLTVREVAQLLNCSIRSAYYYIGNGTIKATNLGQRITRVKRNDIDNLFEKPLPEIKQPEQVQYEISECYTTQEVRLKYGISEGALKTLFKKYNVKTIRKGWFAYVPKNEIDNLLKQTPK